MVWNPASRRALAALVLLLVWLVVPWQSELSAPAVLAPGKEQFLYSPVPAQIIEMQDNDRQPVHQGDVLMRLGAPDLAHRLKLAGIQERQWRWQVEQQPFSADLRSQGKALKSHGEEAQAQVSGLEQETEQLVLRAPFDGEIMARNLDVSPGSWITPRELLYAVADRRESRVDAYVGEPDLERLHVGEAARFVPEAAEFGRRDCLIDEIEPINIAELQEAALASTYGGPLPVHVSARSSLIPLASLYRVRLAHCQPSLAPALRLRGTAHLEADGRSILVAWLRQGMRILIRESGF